MEFLTRKVHLPWVIYRFLPVFYVAGAILLWVLVDHMAATLFGAALVVLAANVALKRISAS